MTRTLNTLLLAGILFGSTNQTVGASTELSPSIFKIGMTKLIGNVHPYDTDQPQRLFELFFYQRPLMYTNDQGKTECFLCTQVPTFENKQVDRRKSKRRSYLVANWRIRKDAKWGDGRAITVRDVLFTWEIIKSLRATGATNLEQFSNIDSIVEHGNPREFQIAYYQLRSDYDQLDNFFLLPAHIEQPIWEKSDKKLAAYFSQSLYKQEHSNPALYNGPFLVTRFTDDKSIQLKHNPQFYEPSKLSSIFIWKLKGINELKWAYRNKAVDMIPENELSLPEAISMKKNLKQKNIPARVEMVDSHRMNQMMLNLRNPLLANPLMRTAIFTAIDTKKMIEKVFQNAVKISHQPFGLESTEGGPTTYSPSRANKILDQLGWMKSIDSPYRAKEQSELSLVIDYPEDDSERGKVSEEIATQLKVVGIKASIKGHPTSRYFHKFIPRAEFRDFAIFSWLTIPGQLPYSILYSEEVPTYQNDYHGQNIGAWRSNKVDKLLHEFTQELDIQKRDGIAKQVLAIWQKEQPFLPLYYEVKTTILNTNLKGFKLNKSSLPSSMTSEYWSY